ncbi:MAG: hypothetical protein J6T27_00010 [Alphaproteobacteria bacterium]|nr:hypothetical protein [Alphaproteobacteria bacterium]
MKKFIFPIFMALFSGVAFGEETGPDFSYYNIDGKSKDIAACNVSKPGDWCEKLSDNSTIHGISLCSNIDPGEHNIPQNQKNVAAAYNHPNGKFCYCKLQHGDVWVNLGEFGSQADCSEGCAHSCGYYFTYDDDEVVANGENWFSDLLFSDSDDIDNTKTATSKSNSTITKQPQTTSTEPNCVQPGNLMDIPSNQTTGNGHHYIKSDDYLDESPRYLKCGQDDTYDIKYCPHDAIVVDSERKVYKCTAGNVWSIVNNIQPCTETSETLIESGLKNNYRQAKKEGNNFVLFYNQTKGKYLLKYCLSPIGPFKQMEADCNKRGDLDSGICYKLTTISNNTATSPTKASDSIELQNSEQTIPTDSLQETGDYETHEEFDSAAWRRDTENAYKHERDNAQSWANKGITAGSTLLTGEGAMMAAQAIAEQKADRDAEIEMAEWISKMGCEYGNGQPVNLGKEETLPGGNELTQYYTEYKQLADKLKATKTALNLRPGIEAEVLYDRAETGLYQYANAERQSGGFTSLSRALMNPEGTDAEQWNAQKAEVAKDLTTGTLLTAGGLLVGASNILVNRNHKKEYQELEKKFKEIEEKLLIEYPEVFSIREDKPVIEIIEEETEEVPIPEQSVTPKRITFDNLTAKSGAFKSGYASLTDEGTKGVADAMQLINDHLNNYVISAIKITATGHSDPEKIDSRYIARITNNYNQVVKQEYFSDKFDRIAENEQLSTARAQAVVTALLDKIKMNNPSLPWPTYFATGFDGTECKQPKQKYAECRYVDITIELDVIKKQN